jgi:ABC-2 type transport system permease protein
VIALLKKEISAFLNSLTGYLVIGVFLLTIGLLMWMLPGTEFNLVESGAANLDTLFILAPWMFMFLVPAVTMKSFAEEKKSGTMELLVTRPLTETEIVMAKFLAALTLVVFSLLPTLLYYYSVYRMATPAGNIDTGSIWGSYLGLLLLGSGFTAIGIFASALTENQVISFLLSLLLCYVLYAGLDYAARALSMDAAGTVLVYLGINSHYASISRGVIDTRDVIYFLSLSAFFLFLTRFMLEKRKW